MSDKPERKLNAFNEAKLRIFGEPVNGSKRAPWIGVSIFGNNPRLEVQTNVDGDKNYGFINGNMDSTSFYMMLAALRKCIGMDSKCQYRVPNQTGPFNEMRLASTIYVGKDDEGCVYISVIDVDKERPKIKFVMMPSSYHTLTDESGAALSKAEISTLFAEGWVDLISKLIPPVLAADYTPPPPREDRPQGGNKQWNNNGGGGNKNWNNGGGKKQWNNNGGGNKKWNGGGNKGNWNNNGGNKGNWNNNNNNNGNSGGGNNNSGGGQDGGWGDDDFPM